MCSEIWRAIDELNRMHGGFPLTETVMIQDFNMLVIINDFIQDDEEQGSVTKISVHI